jgi:hypothetical protein
VIPPEAADSDEERELVAGLFDRYNREGYQISAAAAAQLSTRARERSRRHPLRTDVLLPLARAAAMTLAPLDGYGLGTLPVLNQSGLRIVACAYQWLLVGGGALALVLLGWRRPASRPLVAAIALYVVGRALVIAWMMPVPEPRYLVESLPLLTAAFGSLVAMPGRSSEAPSESV